MIGNVKLAQGQYEAAIKNYFLPAKEINKTLYGDDTLLVAHTNYYLAKANVKLKNFDEAQKQCIHALEVYKTTNNTQKSLICVYTQLAMAEIGKGDTNRAFKCLTKVQLYAEKLWNNRGMDNETQELFRASNFVPALACAFCGGRLNETLDQFTPKKKSNNKRGGVEEQDPPKEECNVM